MKLAQILLNNKVMKILRGGVYRIREILKRVKVEWSFSLQGFG
jgi:hypothetical protein